MAEAILMPRLSDTMTEGVIAAWHKKVGDTVKKGDLLAEIETDKATMELESYKDGTLLHIGGDKGVKIQVDDLLAIVGKAGEDISALLKGGGTTAKKEDLKNEATTQLTNKPVDQSTTLDVSKMDEVVLMPRLSDTMEEGVIAAWHKNVGDTVKKGEVLAEIETDKATMELESYKNGTLLYQGAKTGEKIAVNELLCIIGEADMNIDAIIAAAKGGGTPAESTTPVEVDATTEQSASTKEIIQPSATTPQPVAEVVNEGRIIASPLAKKVAEGKGVDLKYVKGTGDNGRIVKSDIDGYSQEVNKSVSQ